MWKQAKGPCQSLLFVNVPKVATGQGHICNCFVKISKSSPIWEHIFSLCIIPSFILALCQEYIHHVPVVSHYILLLVFYRGRIKCVSSLEMRKLLNNSLTRAMDPSKRCTQRQIHLDTNEVCHSTRGLVQRVVAVSELA